MTAVRRPRALLVPITGFSYAVDIYEVLDKLGYEIKLHHPEKLDPQEGPFDLIIQHGLGPKAEHQIDDGLEKLQRIHQLFKDTPILVVSQWKQREVWKKIVTHGGSAFLHCAEIPHAPLGREEHRIAINERELLRKIESLKK